MKFLPSLLLTLLAAMTSIVALESIDVAYDTRSVTFTYEDTGAPAGCTEYPTIFIIHGYLFHSGTFKKLTPLADESSLRLVYINRRGYQGSTPYNSTEAEILGGLTSSAERTTFMNTEGVFLALAVDGLTQLLSLPAAEGGVSVLGWSLGTNFALAFMASMYSDMDSAVKTRLQGAVKSVIILDPPGSALGIADPPGSYIPITDPSIPAHEVNFIFFRWLSAYFQHGDLSTKSYAALEQVNPDPSRPPTLDRMTGLDLLAISDVAGPPKAEGTFAAPFWLDTMADIVDRSIFDPDLRTHWPNITRNWILYGESTNWNVIWPVWQLEERVAGMTTRSRSRFVMLKGANHFAMWDKARLLLRRLAGTQGVQLAGNSGDESSAEEEA